MTYITGKTDSVVSIPPTLVVGNVVIGVAPLGFIAPSVVTYTSNVVGPLVSNYR